MLCSASFAPRAAAQTEPPVSDAQAQAQAAFQEAQDLLDAEDYDGAVTAYTTLITATGGFSPQPYLKRAEAYLGLEDYERAINDANDALTYSAGLPSVASAAQAIRGEVYLEIGNVTDALQDLLAASGEFREDANIAFLLGKAQILSGLADLGVEKLTEYLGLEDPGFEDREAEVYRLRAQGYAGLRRFEDAKADLDQALEVDPADHENHLSLASLFMAEEKFADAAGAFADAIKNYEPADENDDLPPIQAYLARAAALEEVGREAESTDDEQAAFTDAKATVDELLALLPDRPELAPTQAAAQFRLGIAERLLGNLPNAIKALTESVDVNPQGDPEFVGQAYFRRGICFFYLDENELALLDFQAAAGRIFSDPRAKFWEGRTNAKLGNYLDAIRAYGEAIGVSDRYSDAFVHRGLAYFQLGEYEKAITDFNEAIRLKPIDGSPYYYRGVAYSLRGDRDKAITSLTNAIKFDAELAPAYRVLADELRESGQPELANEYDRKASELEAEAPAEPVAAVID
ncbi:MAG: tetratricopeptide repeat protein [Planctomycetota bacterium]